MNKNHVSILDLTACSLSDSWFFKPVSDEEKVMVETVEAGGNDVSWEREEPFSKGKFTHLHQIYTLSDPNVTGRVSVPILLDTKTNQIVSTESADMIKILLERFSPLHDPSATLAPFLYPEARRQEIDEQIGELAQSLGSKVYGIHMAKTQETFQTKSSEFFAALGTVEAQLRTRPWLLEGQAHPSILDLILFATTLRFDLAYHSFFRMTRSTIREGYPAVWNHCCRVYPLVQGAVEMQGILCMYYLSVPLRVKAGITVPRVPVEFERNLAEGVQKDPRGSTLLSAAAPSFVAVFLGGVRL